MVTWILKPLYLLSLFPIFDEATKLCKVSEKPIAGGILQDLLNEWVAGNVASEVDDFIYIS